MQPVSEKIRTVSNTDLYSRDFKRILDDHIPLLRSQSPEKKLVKREIAVRCEGDFYALLAELDIPLWMNYVVLRLNEYTSPTQYKNDRRAVIIPSMAVVNRLIEKYRSKENRL